MKKETLVSIAERSGCSISTVSRVLSGNAAKYRISQRTVARVTEEVKRCNYTPSLLAKGLRTNRTDTIGLLIPNIENSFFAGVAGVVIRESRNYNYKVVVVDTQEDERNEQDGLSALLARRVDGIVAAPCGSNAELFASVQEGGMPLVLIDRCFPGIQSSCVCCDNEKGGWLAVEHLLSLGHRNICFIADSSFREQVTSVRYGAYVAAMTVQQLPLHAVERFNRQTFSQEEMERLLNAIRAREITAALVSNSHAAEWLLELCQTGGIRIPEELSVVCFDQPRIFQGMEPLFTYVEQNSFEMGRRAAELLREAFETGQEHACQKLVLEPKLMIHHSTQTFVK